jgi:hypothetical protein
MEKDAVRLRDGDAQQAFKTCLEDIKSCVHAVNERKKLREKKERVMLIAGVCVCMCVHMIYIWLIDCLREMSGVHNAELCMCVYVWMYLYMYVNI